jgi:hypothetical protein
MICPNARITLMLSPANATEATQFRREPKWRPRLSSEHLFAMELLPALRV